MKACTWHIEWFPWHQEPQRPQRPQWPQQPQQPQWPQWPLHPHFIKKLTELDVSISPDTKMTYPSLLMWDGSSKIHFFIDFWHPFSWRLWRTGMLLFTKLKVHRSNFHYSGPQKNHLVYPEFKIQVTRRVQNIQVCVRTPCNGAHTVYDLPWSLGQRTTYLSISCDNFSH
jgi:hypothetical protein